MCVGKPIVPNPERFKRLMLLAALISKSEDVSMLDAIEMAAERIDA